MSTSIELRAATLRSVAEKLFAVKPHWLLFFREVFGVDGIVRKHFLIEQEFQAFDKTEAAADMRRMLEELRTNDAETDGSEPTRVITVRLPKSLHLSLQQEARDFKTSMNQLCIGKLLKPAALVQA